LTPVPLADPNIAERLRNDLGFFDQIVMTAYIDAIEKISFLRDADFFAQPRVPRDSQNHFSYFQTGLFRPTANPIHGTASNGGTNTELTQADNGGMITTETLMTKIPSKTQSLMMSRHWSLLRRSVK
jgi:hypothetical protein